MDAAREHVDTATREVLEDLQGSKETLREKLAQIHRLAEALEAANERNRELTRELRMRNEDLERFAYVASHDLKEPLRMVSNYLGLIEQRYAEALPDDAREFMAFAVEGAQRMDALLNGLLAYARVESEGREPQPVPLEGVLEDVVANLRVSIDETDATVTWSELPTVEGDPAQLSQLLQNLVSNALKFHGDEPPRVHVDATPEDGSWRVSVHDEGIGIAPVHQERIFEIFQRLHHRDEVDGHGVGLPVCKRIVERHGGTIHLESTPGEGSTFSFTLPSTDPGEPPE